MRILSKTNELHETLKNIKGKNIQIVSAFACGTENVIKNLVDNNESVELIIGTINAFSSIEFIDFCIKLAKNEKKFKFFVDFRYQESVHWKLYTVSDDTIIIGSANLTDKGLSLDRDTCLLVNDNKIYNEYLQEIENLKSNDLVIPSNAKNFKNYFKEYKSEHNKTMVAVNKTDQKLTLREWIKSENFYELPLLLWDDNIPENEIGFIEDKITKIKQDLGIKNYKSNYYWIDHNYLGNLSSGDIILTMEEKNPQNISFFKVDMIIDGEESNTQHIISFSENEDDGPFSLDNDSINILKKSRKYWNVHKIRKLTKNDLVLS